LFHFREIETPIRASTSAEMVGEIDNSTVVKAYARWAPVYDVVFGKVFERGRKASIAAAERIGGRILDVGIGTGISLMDYARSNRVVGVDYSEAMLRKAHERVREHRLDHVAALAVMDAQRLGFADGYFDVVVAQYVITAVPAWCGPVARSSWSITWARRRAFVVCSSAPSPRSPGGSAGGRSSPGNGLRSGPHSMAVCVWSSAARCPRWGISR
jgi:SAM-dependent methyltransferase